MGRIRFGAIAIATLVTTAYSTPAHATSVPPNPAANNVAAIQPIDVETWTLDNGLTVLLAEDHRLPVVAVEVRYMVGSAHEVKGKSGFAHLFEHLMFQGSKNYDHDYFQVFEPIGGRVNGTTSNDRTNYYESVPSNYLEQALWMESDRMESLLGALSLEKLDNQRDVVKNERRQSYENRPYGMVWKYMANQGYPLGHPYQHTTIGSHEDLSAASLDDVKAFFHQYYVPKNAILTIVGDFDSAKTKAMVNTYFAHLAPGKRAPTPTAKRPKWTEAKRITEVDTKVTLPRTHLVWHSPALYEQGDAALDILSGVLTDGKTSRLYKALVYDQQVAKDVAAFQVSRALSSVYVIQATAAPGKTLQELDIALKAALKTALATPPSEAELKRVINAYRKSFYGRIEGVLSRAQLLSTYFHFTGGANYLATDLARYTELSAAKVFDRSNLYIGENNYLQIDIIPNKSKAPAVPGQDKNKEGAQ